MIQKQTAQEKLFELAEEIYHESISNRFQPDSCTAYNILMSAITYLTHGAPLHGSRTAKFFAEAA